MRFTFLAVLLLAQLACTATLKVPEDANIACHRDAECPEGFSCNPNTDLCTAAARLDLEGSDIDGQATVEPTVGKIGTTFVVRFTVTKHLGAIPELWFVNGGTTWTLAPIQPDLDRLDFEFRFQATAEIDPREGAAALLVRLVSEGGIEKEGPLGAALRFDFEGAAVLMEDILYLPPQGHSLTGVTAATVGTTIRSTALCTEPLDIVDDPPTMTASTEADEIAFVLDPERSTSTGLVFTYVVPEGQLSGEYTRVLRLVDEAGNESTVPLSPVLVRAGQPTLVIAQDQVSYLRAPTGNPDEETIGAFTIPAGPYYALAPSDPLSGAETLPADTFSLAEGFDLVLLRFWADELKENLMGSAPPRGRRHLAARAVGKPRLAVPVRHRRGRRRQRVSAGTHPRRHLGR